MKETDKESQKHLIIFLCMMLFLIAVYSYKSSHNLGTNDYKYAPPDIYSDSYGL